MIKLLIIVMFHQMVKVVVLITVIYLQMLVSLLNN